MRLDEKRRVIEVLLCSGDSDSYVFSVCPSIEDGHERMHIESLSYSAFTALGNTVLGEEGRLFYMNYTDKCLEAAYRLIESSPTLRREWFGTP